MPLLVPKTTAEDKSYCSLIVHETHSWLSVHQGKRLYPWLRTLRSEHAGAPTSDQQVSSPFHSSTQHRSTQDIVRLQTRQKTKLDQVTEELRGVGYSLIWQLPIYNISIILSPTKDLTIFSSGSVVKNP